MEQKKPPVQEENGNVGASGSMSAVGAACSGADQKFRGGRGKMAIHSRLAAVFTAKKLLSRRSLVPEN